MAAPLGGSELYRGDAIFEYFPFRAFALTLILGSVWAVALFKIRWPPLEYGWLAVLLTGLLACLSESLHRQDRLTSQGIERRSGILGRRVRLFRYEMVEFVDVQVPGRGSILDVGTVIVRLHGDQLSLVAVQSPHDVARIITLGRDAAVGSNKGQTPS